jgi:hypothetical protein
MRVNHRDTSKAIWVTKDGRRIRMTEMDDGHVLHAVRYVRNRMLTLTKIQLLCSTGRGEDLAERKYHKLLVTLEFLGVEVKRRGLRELSLGAHVCSIETCGREAVEHQQSELTRLRNGEEIQVNGGRRSQEPSRSQRGRR